MIVSWDWLHQYVELDAPPAEVVRRLLLAGLNHEETTEINGDLAIDLEVTSNRPDCLGHIGVAREAAVLFNQELRLPNPQIQLAAAAERPTTQVRIDCPALCPRYTARILRGVKVRPSPIWFARHLQTLGLAPINNVVDVTNYVLMESGQPLHAFDFAKIHGGQIFVREAQAGETFLAINHKAYRLEQGMCVIADADRPVALGGVMGGADTEVGMQTVDLLIEAASFSPMSVRATARKLNLHSDSSYRFERLLDPEGVDWSSRRCCQLIQEFAGGEVTEFIDVGSRPAPRTPIVLRLSQLPRILGIEIPVERVRQILTALGNREVAASPQQVEVIPPSWRQDLTREIDLIEEVARIHGYDQIPEDVRVPMAPSQRSLRDRVLAKARTVLAAAGFDEALTLSVVEGDWSEAFSPWSKEPALALQTPILRRADALRRSLAPSLLGARKTNESLSNTHCELFETAKIYLARDAQLPEEKLLLSLVSSRDYGELKGVVEALLAALHVSMPLEVQDSRQALFAPGQGVELMLGGERLGFLGEVSAMGLKRFELRGRATIAELDFGVLERLARLMPQAAELSPYPPVTRDVNLVVEERVRWSQIAATVQASAGPLLESLAYLDTYRDPQRLGPGQKSLLFSLLLRSASGTLTNEEADAIRTQVVAACATRHAAQLRA
ncbi:MAG TPA: phenylalanine--tRNA ligase subunit beta [Pirellulales bacterium]|jgi:phenylalanyl-tRNA synthetase beta chain|nr:phenylalanine--tRNA ligase subunit beta [Pirellulales bacterium]